MRSSLRILAMQVANVSQADDRVPVDFAVIDSTLHRGYQALCERIQEIEQKIERARQEREALLLMAGRLEIGLGGNDESVWAHIEGQRVESLIGHARHQRQERATGLDVGVLSPREREVFDVLGEGATTRDIGTRLGINHTTVETYVRRIREKLDIESYSQLRYMAIVWSMNP